jgi:hypothetical protein
VDFSYRYKQFKGQIKLAGMSINCGVTKEYPGTVTEFKDSVVWVEIDFPPDTTSSGSKVVCVTTERQDLFPGRKVVVQIETTPGNKAVLWSFALPFVLFVASLASLQHATQNTGLAILLAVFTLIPYYSILWVITARSLGKVKVRLRND